MFKILLKYNIHCVTAGLNRAGRICLSPFWIPLILWLTVLEFLFSNNITIPDQYEMAMKEKAAKK